MKSAGGKRNGGFTKSGRKDRSRFLDSVFNTNWVTKSESEMVDIQKTQGHLLSKARPGPEEIINIVGEELAKLNRRLNLIENRTDSVQDHLNLVDSNLIEKHKSSVSEIRELQIKLQETQAQMREFSELFKRLASRMSDFASRDDVKVMERYLNYWNPLSIVTKNEVEGMIKSEIKKSHTSSTPEESKQTTSKKIDTELAKKDIEELVAKAIEKMPKGGLTHDEVKKITKKHVEDLFGKL